MSARQLGTLGLIGIGWFVAAVTALHFLEAELDRVDDYVSEYANGDYGWLMQSAFLGAGVGTISVALGIRETLLPARRVTASVVIVAIAGIGFFAAIAKTDPDEATGLTTEGVLHEAGSVVVYFALLGAAWMLRVVFKHDPTWESFATRQTWFAIAYTTTLTVAVATPSDGPVGLTQRVFIPVMMAWLATLAANVRQMRPLDPGAAG